MEKNKDLGLAVIGCGRWGINHVRTANKLFNERLLLVSDSDPRAAQKVSAISPEIRFTTELDDIIADSRINAVIVATPAETHFEVTNRLLENDKNVLVEKPITLRSSDADTLIAMANERSLKLMVGHVLLYHPAVIKMKMMVKEGRVGKLQYIYSNRLNLGTIRTEENILWSFAPHDISVIQYITDSNPLFVSAKGAAFLQGNIEDTTLTYLSYPGNVHAHIYVSWLHPFKEQRMVVVGNAGMIVFEDSITKDKLRFYPKGYRRNGNSFEKFDGDYEVVQFDEKQPLAEEQLHFGRCVTEDAAPLTDGKHALDVLRILEKAERSLKDNESSIKQRELLYQ